MALPLILAAAAAFAAISLAKRKDNPTSVTPFQSNVSPFVHGARYHATVRLGVGALGGPSAGSSVIDLGVIAGPFGFGDVEQVEQDKTDKFLFRFVATWTDATGAFIADSPEFRIVSVTPLALATGQVTHLEGKTVTLRTGQRYFGRGDVGFPLSLLVTENAIEGKLQDTGFDDVQAWTDSGDLPKAWQAAEREGNVFATAVWKGEDGKSFTIPDQVKSVWTVDADWGG